MGHRDASDASHVHVADVLSSGQGTALFVTGEPAAGMDEVDGRGDVDLAGCTCVEQIGTHVEVHVEVHVVQAEALDDDSPARNVAGRITTLRATGTEAPCFGEAGADEEGEGQGEGGDAGEYTFSLFDSLLVLQLVSLARNRGRLPISVTLQGEVVAPAAAWRSPRCRACVAESTSCEKSASHACGLGSEARGSGWGEGDGEVEGDGEPGAAAVGLAGGDELQAAALLPAGPAGRADDGGGLAGGPMGCPTDGDEGASPAIDRVDEEAAGDDEEAAVLGMRPAGVALRRVPAVRMGRDADDADPDEADVEADVEADEPGTTRLDALDVDDPAEAPARVRDTWGETVDSCSWISIMWSPNRIVRLSGAFPERKSFTWPSFRLSSACITLCSGR